MLEEHRIDDACCMKVSFFGLLGVDGRNHLGRKFCKSSHYKREKIVQGGRGGSGSIDWKSVDTGDIMILEYFRIRCFFLVGQKFSGRMSCLTLERYAL